MEKMLVVVFPGEGAAKVGFQRLTDKMRKAWERTAEKGEAMPSAGR